MTKTISSQTDTSKRYFLTIDDTTAQAVDCSCPDRAYRHRQCKHMTQFNVEVRKAERFAAIFAKFDVRANGELATRRCYYELGLDV